jgi:adenine C2-methylase RlmN of 23S rRNA A2503 and tRNA A37
MDLAVLEQALTARGEPGYRTKQVWEWVAGGA